MSRGYAFGEDEVGRRRLAPVLSLAVVGSLILGACGDDDADSADTGDTTGSADTAAPDGTEADTGGDTGGDKPTIVLVQNAWTASAIDVAIAKQLIEENLGNPVEVTSIDENTMFAGLSNGDARRSVSSSGHRALSEDEQKYIDDGTVVEIGELGAIGRIGWYVPDYVLEEHPELATWEGFKDPEVAKEFATAETGDKGRFLGTDPSYSQADEAIIANLELPYQVVYSGSEAATIAELDSKVAAGEPIVMYWWAPTAAAGKYNLAEGRAARVHRRVLRRPGRDRLRLPRGRAREARLVRAGGEGSGGVRVPAELPAEHRGPTRDAALRRDRRGACRRRRRRVDHGQRSHLEGLALTRFPSCLCHRDRRGSPVAVTQTEGSRDRGGVVWWGAPAGGGPSRRR